MLTLVGKLDCVISIKLMAFPLSIDRTAHVLAKTWITGRHEGQSIARIDDILVHVICKFQLHPHLPMLHRDLVK